MGGPRPGAAVTGLAVRALPVADPLADPATARDLAQRYLLFDPFVAGERRVDLHPLVLEAGLHARVIAAAEGVARAVGAVARRAFDDPREAARYRLPPGAEALARASSGAGDDASLIRLDVLIDDDGQPRICELNADCPGGHNEATGLPRLARLAGASSLRNPTSLLESLAHRLAQLADGGAVALVHATAYAEDFQVCALVRQALARRGVPAWLCAPTAPRLDGDRVRLKGREVRALYRFFPVEEMDGQANLPGLCEALAAGKLRSLSSFAQAFAQSKTAMARAWALLDDLPDDDRSSLRAHLPLTLDVRDLPAPALLADRRGWVLKRSFGRVGDGVFVGDLHDETEWAEIVRDVIDLDIRGESWVAQRYIPQRPIPTPWGERLLTLGVYVLDGHFVGYFPRLSAVSHVSHDALCVPALVEVSP